MANRPQKAEYQVQQNLIASILYTVRRVSVTGCSIDGNKGYSIDGGKGYNIDVDIDVDIDANNT